MNICPKHRMRTPKGYCPRCTPAKIDEPEQLELPLEEEAPANDERESTAAESENRMERGGYDRGEA